MIELSKILHHLPKHDRTHRWSAWLAQIAKGDIDAFASLYDESSDLVFSFVQQIVHDRTPAEDTLVEIYNEVRREAGRFSSSGLGPVEWLITIARNVAVGRRRDDPFKDKRRVSQLALARLSDEQRSILEMTYCGGLSAAEVAGVLDLPLDYVKEQIVCAMQALRSASHNVNHSIASPLRAVCR